MGLADFLRDPEMRNRMIRDLVSSANRGVVANTLGAPVDAATNALNLGIAGAGYLGHKAGLLKEPLPLIDMQDAIGSSEWIGRQMQERGMVSAERNPIAEAGFSMLAPFAGRATAAVASGTRKAAENASNGVRPGPISSQRGAIILDDDDNPKTFYHGTSQVFEKFQKKYGGSVWDDKASKNAFFFTANPAEAEHFATIAAARKGGSPRKIEANIDFSNFETVTPNELSKATREWLNTLKPSDREAQMLTKQYESPDGGISKPLEYAILQAKKRGKDGVLVQLDDGTDWAVVFNQKSIIKK